MVSDNKKNSDSKTPLTGFSGRESVFDQRLRELRTTGQFERPDRSKFVKKNTTDFDTPSMDSQLKKKVEDDSEYTETERMAFIDERSGLLNSRSILQKLALEMRRSARYKHGFSLLVLELDRFGQLDSLTPLAVDMIFANFCKVVGKNIREVDKLGRFDEQSLIIVCPETGPGEAVVEADRLRHIVSQTSSKQVGHPVGLTVSIGIASFPGNGTAAVEILGAALEAAQEAVAAGGNTVCSAKTSGAEPEKFAPEDFSPQFDAKPDDFSVVAKDKQDATPEIAFPSTAEFGTVIP